AAKLVRGRDAVRDEERRRPRVLGDDAIEISLPTLSPYFLPESDSIFLTSGWKRSVRYVSPGTPWSTWAMRSSPAPVSMFRLGRGTRVPSALRSYCWNTKFQISR